MRPRPRIVERVLLAALALIAVPVTGFVIAWPLWYLSVHQRAVFSVLVLGGTVYLLLRNVVRKRSHR